MSINKKQFDRIRLLHQNLSRKRRYTWQQIQELYRNELGMEVGKRTVYLDLTRLREDFQAPIVSEKGVHFYSESFSLYGIFNPSDVHFAADLALLFEQYAQLPAIVGLDEVRLKVKEKAHQDEPKQVVQFEQNANYSGLKHLNTLYDKIREKTCLRIRYKDFEKEPKTYSLSPYLLKEYSNRWHVYGYEMRKNKLYNLALDRILDIEPSDFPYREQQPNELDYLEEIIGFTYFYDMEADTYQPVEEVQIAFQLPRANYVMTKPLHVSQEEIKELRTETRRVFRYQLRQNRELIAKILEFGSDAEVLTPASLRDKIKEQVSQLRRLYGDTETASQ